eukprot:GEMP01066447.1.p1 GENE.GEMP01066447.1~~GEMP01066447.1.p1  ORF type:complete len:156 (-),score=29.01 GEMP01066447.1:839-1282(-)
MDVWEKLKDKFRVNERCEEASCKDSDLIVQTPGNVYPPARDEIGRATWRYLHTMAAHYPEQPTPEEALNAQEWLVSFVNNYPCRLCAEDFIAVCSKIPPRMETRKEYSLWFCHAHNGVRKDLSQPVERCRWPELNKAYSQGKTLTEI